MQELILVTCSAEHREVLRSDGQNPRQIELLQVEKEIPVYVLQVTNRNWALGDVPSTFVARAVSFRHAAFILSLAITCNAILAASLLMNARTRYGAEVGGIAASIAEGRGFSSPFPQQPTGPSAWIPPAYPYLLAGIFRVFGVFTSASYRVATAFNIVIHAITCMLLYKAAGRVFQQRVGFYSACALASFPLLFYPLALMRVLPGNAAGQSRSLFIPPTNIWYNYLSELAILVLILCTLVPRHWSVCGVTWGVSVLINPTLLALAPAFGVHLLKQHRSQRYLGLAACVAALCISPWLARDYLLFHRLIPIRDNFGVELNVGNQPGQKGLWKAEVHPSRNTYELNRLAEMGEAEYTAAAKREALHTIRIHLAEFAGNTIRRVGYWWIGTPADSTRLGKLRFLANLPPFAFSALAFCGVVGALRDQNRGALLFVAVLLFYPIAFYLTHTFSVGYVYPIHPEMLALATSAVLGEKVSTSP